MEKVTFKERLVEAMRETGMSAAELSRITGINEASLSRYVHGSVEPKQNFVYQLAKALDVSEVWLMGFSDHKSRFQISDQKLTTDEVELLSMYRKLNAQGKALIRSMAEDYSAIPKYKLPQEETNKD